MLRKKKRNFAIYGGVAVGFIVAVMLIAEGVTSIQKGKVDTKEGLAYIEQSASGDIAAIENKIQMIEDKDKASAQTEEGEKNYKALFANSVIMGDSISEAFTEYGYLTTSSAVAKIGVELDELDEQIETVTKLNPQNLFLAYGMNDIVATNGNVSEFIKQYESLLDQIKEALPNTKIFVNSIFPVREDVVRERLEFTHIQEFNKKLEELCDKRQITFLDNTDLVSEDYYEADGMHFKSSFYPYWLDKMAEVAEL